MSIKASGLSSTRKAAAPDALFAVGGARSAAVWRITILTDLMADCAIRTTYGRSSIPMNTKGGSMSNADAMKIDVLSDSMLTQGAQMGLSPSMLATILLAAYAKLSALTAASNRMTKDEIRGIMVGIFDSIYDAALARYAAAPVSRLAEIEGAASLSITVIMKCGDDEVSRTEQVVSNGTIIAAPEGYKIVPRQPEINGKVMTVFCERILHS